jgi:hypothetical protein
MKSSRPSVHQKAARFCIAMVLRAIDSHPEAAMYLGDGGVHQVGLISVGLGR